MVDTAKYFEVVPIARETIAARLQWLQPLTACKFITLHNTAAPSLAQWHANRATYSSAQLVSNMESYWRGLGWHTGAHYLVTPETDSLGFELSDPGRPGVHASCFNNLAGGGYSIGVEMVGEFATETFDGIIRDNAIELLAQLHIACKIAPLPYLYGVRGLHFHVDCKRDNHDCPGKNVKRPDLNAAIQARMTELTK